MSDKFNSLFVKKHQEKNNNSNSFNILKQCITIIHQSKSLKDTIYNKIWNRVFGSIYGISYIGIFCLFMKMSSENSWWFEIAIFSIPTAAFVGTAGMLAILLLTHLIESIFKINREHLGIYSKKFRHADNDLKLNKKIVIEMLESPKVQHEVLSFLKDLKNSLNENTHKSEILRIDEHLNELITYLSQKNYENASSFITIWFHSWLRIKNEAILEKQKIMNSSNDTNAQKAYLKSINFSLDNTEVEIEKKYNIKAML